MNGLNNYNITLEKEVVKNDLRITKVENFIRKTSIDEFTQFINVLKGDMSLFGPRPGVTGYWEVSHFAKITMLNLAKEVA